MVTESENKKMKCPQSRDPRGFHNFPTAGSNCTYCGMSQDELSGRKLKRMSPAFEGEKDVK